MERKTVTPKEIEKQIMLSKDKYYFEDIKDLKGTLSLPSYVHGYSLAIQYMYDWFRKKFPEQFFQGGIFINGKHVLDDYTRLNEYNMKNIVKGHNPRAAMTPTVEYDYDREGLDLYMAPPEVYLRRSNFQESFFIDRDRNLYLTFIPRDLRMNVNYKIRVNTKSQQLDLFNKMELDFRNGATQQEYISVDFHVPKEIMLNIADCAGFEIVNSNVVNVLGFLDYLNAHSELPFLYKIRAINQKPEYFIRVNKLYTHIAVRDKLQLSDGERDGKLDTNFDIEMAAILDIPVPHYYAYYSSKDATAPITLHEKSEGTVAIYSINIYDIPKVDENGWNVAAITDYQTDNGDTVIELGEIFKGDNPLSKAIHHSLAKFVSPSKFINIKLYRDDDVSKEVEFKMNWKTMNAELRYPEEERVIHIAIYFDRSYVNALDISLNDLQNNRISSPNIDKKTPEPKVSSTK